MVSKRATNPKALGSDEAFRATPQQRMLLELARNVISVPERKHQDAVCSLRAPCLGLTTPVVVQTSSEFREYRLFDRHKWASTSARIASYYRLERWFQ